MTDNRERATRLWPRLDGSMSDRTAILRLAAYLDAAEQRGAEQVTARVLKLTYASDDGTEWDHNPRCSGEAECPACWAQAIRSALTDPEENR